MSDFDELLKSLKQTEDDAETLAKSAPGEGADGGDDDDDDDDDAVAAAAADSGVALPAGEGDDDEGEDDEGEEFGKSFGQDADGNDLVDATDLVKSILEHQEKTDDVLAKAMTSMVSAMSKQNDLIKSLQSQVATLAGQGRGRKAMLNVHEKPNPTDVMAKSQAGAAAVITPSDLLAKADAAYQAGQITGAQANTVDVCLRNNWPIDPGILQKLAVA